MPTPPSDPFVRFDPQTGQPLLPEANADARTWGMVGHLSALAVLFTGIGNVVGPLVVYLIKKDTIPFAADQAREALNFHLTWTIVALALSWTLCIGIGFVVLPAIYLFTLVMAVVAAIKANTGEWYRYPLTWRLVK